MYFRLWQVTTGFDAQNVAHITDDLQTVRSV